ncbi:hypothetical protein ABIE65_001891 [Constrictibacter sp. MBR-5]|jgi:hypothetical protein|uniref:hypothetical protein n=1 Tax=Constrictibacter sp. MBR-5 TaxID=3156467 RepID=UPI0033997874
MQIGEILIAAGAVTAEDVQAALRRQQSAGGLLGDNLVALGLLTPERLEGILKEMPQPPRTLAETGIAEAELLNLMLKVMYTRSLDTPSRIADGLMLPARLVGVLMADAERRQLVESMGMLEGPVLSEVRYALSQAGRRRALEALEANQYTGPAPVSLSDYHARVLRQRITNERIGRARVDEAFADLTIPGDFVDRLGPAINSGRALLLYGPAGNGKTSIAERIGGIFGDIVYVPYAIEIEGQYVKVFDPDLHEVAATQPKPERIEAIRRRDVDRRWVPCKRPIVITGGELSLEMLDLQWNPQARFYEAPLHMKAIGGTFIIDDFGRQLVSPERLLNRWIVPMQSRFDYLKLHTGKSFSVPFDELLIFSTNMAPQDLMDPAFLRRIPYKLETPAPTMEVYHDIFTSVAEASGLPFDEDIFRYIVDRLTNVENQHLACYQPKFIVDQVIAACKYEGVPPMLTRSRVSIALDNLYVRAKAPAPGHHSPFSLARAG